MYIERRYQPFWLLGLGLVMTFSLGVAYGSVIATQFGWAIGLISSALVLLFWLRGESTLKVDSDRLIVGKASIESEFIGTVKVMQSADFAVRIRQQALRTDFLSILRHEKGGVIVEITDDRDPHRHWVIGTRNPAGFAQAIESIRTNNH